MDKSDDKGTETKPKRISRRRLLLSGSILLSGISGFFLGGLATRHTHERLPPRPAEPRFSSLSDRLAAIDLESNGHQDLYAVILNGDDSNLHRGNVSLAHSVLVNNNYSPDNIFVLSYQDTGESGFLIHAPTFENLEMLFREFLQKKIDSKDYLTTYVTGHGDAKGRTSEISIKEYGTFHSKATLSEIEFAYLLGNIEPAQTIFIFDPCHGRFGMDIPMANYLVVSRASITETGSCKHFTKKFLELLDPKQQGRISIGEALETTLRFDPGYRAGSYTPTCTGPLSAKAHEIYLSPETQK